jgi:filamentous hemagglutinin family protein
LKSERTKIVLIILIAASVWIMPCYADSVDEHALPVVSDTGTAMVSVDPVTSTMTWTATEPITTMQLASGDVGGAATLNIVLPTDASRLLAEVMGGEPSYWDGRVNCLRGLFVFENQAGLTIGKDAQVNINNFIATTLDISANNFRNGDYIFEHSDGSPYSQILNRGTITGNNIALIASAVDNQGTVIGRLGNVFFISGDRATVTFDTKGIIQV